ncbi:unnamed protein product [Rotaria socialis]|uniref:Poly [ADP-ribose] polymerase n=3 Tax=Rotaria socialis TaxID=392032 RepID=A0A820T2R8_9BILA|nr:unnamed protein product [Rotaria socialis]
MTKKSSSISSISNRTFVLELGRDVRFKAKQELADYVLVSNDADTYKTRRAKQLGIPLINFEYIYAYRDASKENQPIDLKRFIIWNSDDVELPRFHELTFAEIGKWAIFKETNDNSDVYFAIELQIIPEEYNNQSNNDYRLRFRYEKRTITKSKGNISLIQYAFSNDINELHQFSKLLLRSLFLDRIDTQMLDDNVCQLVESLWIESISDLNNILAVKPETITLKTIVEAEAALLEIASDSKSSSEAEKRFHSLIPHQKAFVVDLTNNRRILVDKLDLCQMLRDMVSVNELTNWNIKASVEAKCRALKCHIEPLKMIQMNNKSFVYFYSNEQVIIHQIYSVAKQTDTLNFRSTLFNQKQFFHGSKYNNFLGILSRGLLMPKVVVNNLGVVRTDIGCLGYGLYFSDSASTSLKYTTPSVTRPDRRLLCISQVALGESAKFYSYTSNLTQPPENFHSTHGVKKNDENNSKFVDDEYAIYNLDQQRLLYLVELSWIPHDNVNQSSILLPIIRDNLMNQSKSLSGELNVPLTIEDEVIQVAEQDYGLICPSSGQLIPLKGFHIRAQLVDVTAEVVLYQVYHNTSTTPIEAKYVFPLDENSSVCGFEAHINNKISKGIVKEKEQAKREYREAIEKGHGAYLMHQEQPEVFSVSVGNLPANCEVIIKITYVTELSIENNDIIFCLPAKVASWQSKQVLEMQNQTVLPSVNLEQDNSSMKSVEFSLKASVRMPYEIEKLFSPTHRLRRKITDCLAMIEFIDNVLLEKDFILSVTLKSVNLPRLLNETYVSFDTNNNNNRLANENSQACMLTFYPKFEIVNNANEYVEIIFTIDVSNSMDGKHVQQAKQLAHLFLANMKTDGRNILFNIVTFGSDNDECFPISSPNTKENIDKAKYFVLHSLDHRGNTDLFSVLRQYSLLPSSSKPSRQFILLSDGHINNLKSILILLENQSSMRHHRLFACSIGDTSNKHNLRQLANGTNGGGSTTIFDSNYRSRWKLKVLQIFEHVGQPCVTNISIDWHGTIDNQQEKFTNQAQKRIRSLFDGMFLTVYRFIRNCLKATLTATINNQEYVTTVFSNKITDTKGRILHCLTARAIIQDYENSLLHDDECENELIKRYSFTSFVAIEERDGHVLESGVRLLDVMLENGNDLLPYTGWDDERSQIDIIKDKIINAKRVFDSASISNKIELSIEYEKLCQNISHRSSGDAKYELILAIADTYRTTFQEKEKARQLYDKIREDLNNEIINATINERKILEKRLNEMNLRINKDSLEDFEDKGTLCDENEASEPELSFSDESDFRSRYDGESDFYGGNRGGDSNASTNTFIQDRKKSVDYSDVHDDAVSFKCTRDYQTNESKKKFIRKHGFVSQSDTIKHATTAVMEENYDGIRFTLFEDSETDAKMDSISQKLEMNLISPQTAPSDLLSHKKQEKSAYYDDSISLPIVHENQYTAYYPEINSKKGNNTAELKNLLKPNSKIRYTSLELQTEQQESFSPVIRNKTVSTRRQIVTLSSRRDITEKNLLNSTPATTSIPFSQTSTIDTSNSDFSLSVFFPESSSLNSPTINTKVHTTAIEAPPPPQHSPLPGLFSFGLSSTSYNGEARTTSKEINPNQIYSSLNLCKPSSTETLCLSTPAAYDTSNNNINNLIEPAHATQGFSSSPILPIAPPSLSAPQAPFSFASYGSAISSNHSLFEGNHKFSGFAYNSTIPAVAPQLHVASQASFSFANVGSTISNNNLF